MSDQYNTPLPIFDVTVQSGVVHSGEPLLQLTSSVSGKSQSKLVSGTQSDSARHNPNGHSLPSQSSATPSPHSYEEDIDHQQPSDGKNPGSGTVIDRDPDELGDPDEERKDWREAYLAGEETDLTTETSPEWLTDYLAKKQLPIESLISRGCHLMRFEGRKTAALIIPSVVAGEMTGYQRWYDADAPWRTKVDKAHNQKNRWTYKDLGGAFLNRGQIHSHVAGAPVVLMESPPDAAATDTIIVTGEDEHDPLVHCVVACCGASNLPKAAAMINVEFPDRPLVIIAQFERDPKNHAKLAKLAQRAVESHPRATLHHCPDRTEDGERVGNDVSDMFVRDEILSWSALCEAVEPPVSDDVDGLGIAFPADTRQRPRRRDPQVKLRLHEDTDWQSGEAIEEALALLEWSIRTTSRQMPWSTPPWTLPMLILLRCSLPTGVPSHAIKRSLLSLRCKPRCKGAAGRKTRMAKNGAGGSLSPTPVGTARRVTTGGRP